MNSKERDSSISTSIDRNDDQSTATEIVFDEEVEDDNSYRNLFRLAFAFNESSSVSDCEEGEVPDDMTHTNTPGSNETGGSDATL